MTTLDDRPVTRLVFPTGAVQVLGVDAPRTIWLAERRKSIGGSDASTLVRINPYGSPMQLWLEKTGQLPPKPMDSAMEWGILLEPVVRDVWMPRTYDVTFRRCGMLRRPGWERVHANPDGIEVDENGRAVAGLEVKTTNWRLAHQWDDGQTPDHAEAQGQLCMWVTGLRRWWIVGLIDGRDPQVRMLHADDELGQMLADEATRFYTEHVESMAAPALDDSTATNDAVRAALRHADESKAAKLTVDVAELFRWWLDAKAAVKAAEAVEREADSALRLALGDTAEIVDDPTLPTDRPPSKGGRTTYATFTQNGTFAAKRFVDEHPELAAEYTRELPALDVDALKADHPEIHAKFRARVLRTRKPLGDALATLPTPTTEEN